MKIFKVIHISIFHKIQNKLQISSMEDYVKRISVNRYWYEKYV